MKISHTPGTWKLEVVEGESVYGPEGLILATCHRETAQERRANACLIVAAPDMKAVLDELESAFDQETYTEKAAMDFDAPDDHEYTVTITAKQLRAISKAICKAEWRS